MLLQRRELSYALYINVTSYLLRSSAQQLGSPLLPRLARMAASALADRLGMGGPVIVPLERRHGIDGIASLGL